VTFDPTSYVPEPNEWLSFSAKHKGRAKLRFRDPAGSVGGDAELTFDETGEVRIEVRLDPATLERFADRVHLMRESSHERLLQRPQDQGARRPGSRDA
jgi:hypothetical protein